MSGPTRPTYVHHRDVTSLGAQLPTAQIDREFDSYSKGFVANRLFTKRNDTETFCMRMDVKV